MNNRLLLPTLALAATLACAAPAADAGTYTDGNLGVSVDCGEGWDAVAHPPTGPADSLGGAYAAFRRGGATGWLMVFHRPEGTGNDAESLLGLVRHVLKTRFEETGERLVPGASRDARFGRASGVLLSYEAAPATGEGRTRFGHAAMAGEGDRLVLLMADQPTRDAARGDAAEVERLATSLRLGVDGSVDASAPEADPDAGLEGADYDFESAMAMKEIARLDSGLKIVRQYYLMQGGKLPSYVTHLMGKEYEVDGRKNRTPDMLMLVLDNREGEKDAKLRAEVVVPGYSEAVSRTVTVDAGQSTILTLTPAFTERLFDLTEQRPGIIKLQVYDMSTQKPSMLDKLLKRPPGRLIHEESERVLLLGRNDFFWVDGKGRSWAPAISTFVTPHDGGRMVDSLLKEAAVKSPFGAIVGYQEVQGATKRDIVLGQFAAVWQALAAKDFRYVNAPFSVDAAAQRIKHPAECIDDGGGNCIEVALVFASALEAMGMRPVILIYPGHAQVGVRAWQDDDTLFVVEATLCGSSTFEDGLRQGDAYFKERKAAQEVLGVLDIRELRALGFAPIPR